MQVVCIIHISILCLSLSPFCCHMGTPVLHPRSTSFGTCFSLTICVTADFSCHLKTNGDQSQRHLDSVHSGCLFLLVRDMRDLFTNQNSLSVMFPWNSSLRKNGLNLSSSMVPVVSSWHIICSVNRMFPVQFRLIASTTGYIRCKWISIL